eukprot:2701812-Pleurochrysis_carterae.AAC.1
MSTGGVPPAQETWIGVVDPRGVNHRGEAPHAEVRRGDGLQSGVLRHVWSMLLPVDVCRQPAPWCRVMQQTSGEVACSGSGPDYSGKSSMVPLLLWPSSMSG